MFSLDISNHRRGINIQQLKNEGLLHLYLKATEGMGYVDPSLNDFYNKAVACGVPIGYYHYVTANPDVEGQAEDFYNAVKGRKADLKYAVDIEVELNNPSDVIRRFINKFESLMGKSGICCIYSGGYYARDNIENDIKQNYPLWVAHYGASKPMETGFKTLAGWQYSENEYHGGQPCDSNIFYEPIMLDCSVVANNTTTQNSIGKIAELQRICGVVDDGIWGPVTDAAVRNLPLAGLKYRTPELTKWVQARVGCTVDGIFGIATEDAVKGWQSKHGLVVDGIVGYNTIKSLALA